MEKPLNRLPRSPQGKDLQWPLHGRIAVPPGQSFGCSITGSAGTPGVGLTLTATLDLLRREVKRWRPFPLTLTWQACII
ncbi:hypothetical protein [Cohnella nanjingensis]|uniref:Uncharacterized protein n=1 Tax=Cohnella nanjingensis TaxID=1387779 RepID=A0A7X0RLS7_9BACL|nr:hypothetical protein [Cohnella nanjingensis]MBB6669884.1 hypothetical protein [Cohnella nanjingensis]